MRRYHSTTGSLLTIRADRGLNRTACTVLAIAVGILSWNQTAMGLPVALRAVIVSVSREPSWPPRLHRRAIIKPDSYRCTGNVNEAVSWGRVGRGGLEGERAMARPTTTPATAVTAARQTTARCQPIRGRRRPRWVTSCPPRDPRVGPSARTATSPGPGYPLFACGLTRLCMAAASGWGGTVGGASPRAGA